MADVFISYTKPERQLSETLAIALQAAGHSVWWDAELLPNDSFRAEIDAQLNACSAVVIIWSAKAAISNWVLSEADHALRQGKLINAHHSDIRPEDLPKPFGQIHAVSVTDTNKIIESVKHLRTGSAKAKVASSTEASATTFIRDAINDATNYARLLRELADSSVWESDDAYSTELLTLAEKVYTPLRLFRERLPFAEVNSYKGRRLVEHMDAATTIAYHQLRKEIGWLQSYGDRPAVVSGARGDLSHAASNLLDEAKLPAE